MAARQLYSSLQLWVVLIYLSYVVGTTLYYCPLLLRVATSIFFFVVCLFISSVKTVLTERRERQPTVFLSKIIIKLNV